MKKLALATAISTFLAPAAFADDVHHFTTVMASGTADNPMASFVNTAASTVGIWYVDPASGTASDRTALAVQLVRSSDWTFDFTNPAAVAFSGALYLGDYKVQTNVSIVPGDGRQTFTGVVQNFSGTGVYDETTNTFTYQYFNTVTAGGGGSVYSASAPATCLNGRTAALGKVCSYYAAATPSWEGLALNFVFAEDKSSFAGSLQGRDTGGSGISALSSLINWTVWGGEPALVDQAVPSTVPLPASAWLFGSSLLGLVARRRRR